MTGREPNRSFLLTPSGAGAIAVVRVRGPEAPAIVSQAFQPKGGLLGEGITDNSAPTDTRLARSDQLRFGRFVADDDVIDEVIVSQPSGGSPPVVDITVHGGVRIIERILQTLEQLGAPFHECGQDAEGLWPLENMIHGEAIDALSSAKTERVVRFLAYQRLHLGKAVEQVAELCGCDPARARVVLSDLMEGCRAARRSVEGVTAAIIGPPNAGKSTLFNNLLGRSATVVSAQEGTTRDWVSAGVEINGIPFTLVDTAGWSRQAEPLEREAIGSGWAKAEQADLCILVLDGSGPLPTSEKMTTLHPRLPRVVWVSAKADLDSSWALSDLPTGFAGGAGGVVRLSARTGEGMDRLKHIMLEAVGLTNWVDTRTCLFTERQQKLGEIALSDLPQRPSEAGNALKQILACSGIQ